MNASFTELANAVIFELKLPNDLTALQDLNLWLEQCAHTIGLSTQITFRLQLLLEEVVLNILENAYRDNEQRWIELRLSAWEEGLVVRIVDDGIPFDQTVAPSKPVIVDLDTLQMGGLGLHLLSVYSDRQSYLRREGKNILSFKISDVYMEKSQ